MFFVFMGRYLWYVSKLKQQFISQDNMKSINSFMQKSCTYVCMWIQKEYSIKS